MFLLGDICVWVMKYEELIVLVCGEYIYIILDIFVVLCYVVLKADVPMMERRHPR